MESRNILFKKSIVGKVAASRLLTIFVSGLIFFLITMVFRQFFNIMAVMGIRPSALPPVFGLMLGPFGVLGCALGNLLADVISGYSVLLSVLGFVAQFTYGILPYLMWNAYDELRKKGKTPINLGNAGNVVRYMVITVINGIVVTLFIGSIIHNIGASHFISTSTMMLLLNNIVFCIVFGIPLIVFMSAAKRGIREMILSINERLVLIFLLTGIVSGALIGIFARIELSYAIADPVTMWMRVYLYIAVNLFVFYMIAVAFLWYCERKITLPVESIAEIAKSVVSDGREKQESKTIISKCEKLIKKVGNKSEAGVLAEAFRTMILDLDTYIKNLTMITTENERIATELNVAKQMQADMLPNIFPAFPEREEFEIYAMMEPAKEIGGDFYDFFMIDKDHLGIVIADVSGKGIPAALFMVITRTLISNWARNDIPPKEVLEKVNNQLCEGNESAMFVTAWMGILEISSGELTYSSAGHDPPFLKRKDTSFEEIQINKNLMLGAMDSIYYKQSVIKLYQGDRLFLYTDGVTEANNQAEQLFGKKRLLDSLNKVSHKSLEDALTQIKGDIDAFANEEPQFDDITMVMLLIK